MFDFVVCLLPNLYIVELVAPHAQVFVHGEEGGYHRQEDAQEQDGAIYDQERLQVEQLHEARELVLQIEQGSRQHQDGQNGRDDAAHQVVIDEGAANEARRGSDQSHRVDQETLRVEQQADGVAYQHEGDDCQQGGQSEQDHAYALQVVVHHLHHVFAIEQLVDARVALDLLLDELQAVGVGIVGVQLHLDRGLQGVEAQEGLGALAQLFLQLLGGLLFRDVFGRLDVGQRVESLLHLHYVCLFLIVFQHDRERDVFFYIDGELVSKQPHQHDQPHQE